MIVWGQNLLKIEGVGVELCPLCNLKHHFTLYYVFCSTWPDSCSPNTTLTVATLSYESLQVHA